MPTATAVRASATGRAAAPVPDSRGVRTGQDGSGAVPGRADRRTEVPT